MKHKSLVLLLLVLTASPLLADEKYRMLFEFEKPEAAKPWQTVNDGVMGGRSDGRFRINDDKNMEFFGTLSLENNGGFASVRARGARLAIEKGDVIVARVRGDGREYKFNLYSQRNRYSYRQSFKTKKDEWIEVEFPVNKSAATWRGRRYPNEKLDPSSLTGLGFLLGDKKPGPFKLEVEWIKVGKSLGSNTLAQTLSESKRLTIDGGIELHYIEQGTGDPILFVHGATGDCFTWTRQLNDFARAGYRAIAYSRRLNYPNENKLRPDHSGADEARDLAQFIRKLDVGKVDLVGFSAGANASIVATLDHPELVRTLTLAEPPLISWLANLPGDDREKGLAMLRQLGGNRVEPVKVALASGDDVNAAREWVDSFGGKGAFDQLPKSIQESRIRNIGELKAIMNHRRYYPHVDRERVQKLKVPTLVLSGGKTTATAVLTDPELERLLPKKSSKRVTIKDAGHIMFIDQPESCLKAVLDFIRESG